MLRFLYHVALVFISTFMLTNSFSHFVIFLSNQGLLGSPGDEHHDLKTKCYKDWTDAEAAYVITRLLMDTFLIALFILQHSIMATDMWKQVLSTCYIRISERLLYVLATSCILMKLMTSWSSTPEVGLWEIDTTGSLLLRLFFFLLHGACWVIIFVQCSIMDPLEMLGIKQVYYFHKGASHPLSYKSWELRTFYGHLRHAGPVCLWIILWVHPVMTLDRLLLALVFTIYLKCSHRVTIEDYKYAKAYFVWSETHTTTTKRKI